MNIDEISAIGKKKTLNILSVKHGHTDVIHRVLKGHVEARSRSVTATFVGQYIAPKRIAINNIIVYRVVKLI